jgi:hypothetical protein
MGLSWMMADPMKNTITKSQPTRSYRQSAFLRIPCMAPLSFILASGFKKGLQT